MQPELEFSRTLKVDSVSSSGRDWSVTAKPEECQALAERFSLPALHSLTAKGQVWRLADGSVRLEGVLTASLDQICVVTLEQFTSTITAEVEGFFSPHASDPVEGELVFGPDDECADPIINGRIEIGEVIAEDLSLALDPFPRREGAVFTPQNQPPDAEDTVPEKVNPFAALKVLQKK